MDKVKLQEMLGPVQEDLDRFDSLTDQILQADSALIGSVVRYLLEKRGKRIRPAISFLVSRAAGLNHKKMVQAALAIELIHTATLLHDDVVDESPTRRGQDTINFKWNNLVSVLMGDFFFAKAFRLLVDSESPELVAQVSYATERVSFGELRQIEEAYNWNLEEVEYHKIISHKTAALFAVSAASCAILNGNEKKRIRRHSEFGEKLGQAFQIADDILDLVGDSRRTGKQIGLDLLQGKVTLPLIYALREGPPTKVREIMGTLNNGLNRRSLPRVIKFIDHQGGIAYARSRAAELGNSALAFIAEFPRSKYRRALEELINFSINRDN